VEITNASYSCLLSLFDVELEAGTGQTDGPTDGKTRNVAY